MNKTDLEQCKINYCIQRNISDHSRITLEFLNFDANRDPVFRVKDTSKPNTTNFTNKKLDLSYLSSNRCIGFSEDELLNQRLVSKSKTCTWLNSKLGLNIKPIDIENLIVTNQGLNVIINLDSMRFKNNFIINYV